MSAEVDQQQPPIVGVRGYQLGHKGIVRRAPSRSPVLSEMLNSQVDRVQIPPLQGRKSHKIDTGPATHATGYLSTELCGQMTHFARLACPWQ